MLYFLQICIVLRTRIPARGHMMVIFQEKLSLIFLGIDGHDVIMTSSPRDIYTWEEFHFGHYGILIGQLLL